jgi:hypothetical protein
MAFAWNYENTVRAVKLHMIGKSAAEIARELAPDGSLSRSAVIGKLARVPSDPDLIPKDGEPRLHAPVKKSEPSKPKPKPKDPPPSPVTRLTPRPMPPKPEPKPKNPPIQVEDIRTPTGGCKYITVFDGADSIYCGRPIDRGSYCRGHADRCYTREKAK